MRKVAGGEASAVPHTTFVGHSARQASTNPMILKQAFPTREPPIEEGPPPMQPEAEAEDPEDSEMESSLLKELIKCLDGCHDLTDELSRQGFDSGKMLDGKISQLQQEIESLMGGGGEESLHSALSRLNLRFGGGEEPEGPI